jgi:hypothetical protein
LADVGKRPRTRVTICSPDSGIRAWRNTTSTTASVLS